MYLPVIAVREDDHVAGLTLSQNTITYVPIASLEQLVGTMSVLVVGPLTASNSDSVVFSGGVASLHKVKEQKVDVAAGELLTRSTGVYESITAATSLALKTADGTQDRTSLVVVKVSTGIASVVDGTLAAAGASVAPACPAGSLPLATALVPAASEEPSVITDVRPRP